ncbi:hypothetical protein [Virgisporangium aurantiacum]|uniref:Uncharacterized protein n=1 Tax=Virgisporangium aurantiacum TaxID=175570 RepID=A0A8J4E7H7_9ACTN|nr:hypothetical protein [Virgisporangium aurantiacum]GIJ64314.1 hypothetical protein Vau01_118300 [Virgisporangium aurantiacum]
MLYAEMPTRRLRQTAADLLAAAWVGAWAWIAVKVYRWVGSLAAVGDTVHKRGQSLATDLDQTAAKLRDIPLVGDRAADPLAQAADAARSLAAAGRTESNLVHDLAVLIVILIVIGPVGLIVVSWLPRRLRWVTDATAASRLRHAPGGADLLALRALANQPLRTLARLDLAPLKAWQHGESTTVRTLANLELRRLGLRPAPTNTTQLDNRAPHTTLDMR